MKKYIFYGLLICFCTVCGCTKEVDVDAKGEFVIGGGVTGSMHPK